MIIKEYRIPLPMTVEEYRIAQLYMIQKQKPELLDPGKDVRGRKTLGGDPGITSPGQCLRGPFSLVFDLSEILKKSRNETFGEGSGVEILENRPYTDGPGGSGQYTHKVYHVGMHIPSWFRSILPKAALRVVEESWNAYPYTRTRFTCPFVEKFSIDIETFYKTDAGENPNVFSLSPVEKNQLTIDFIDIVKDPVPPNEYKTEEDPKLFYSTKTQRGPLSENWIEEYKQQVFPIMCAYKLCKVEFRYWGMQSKIERFIHDTGLRKVMVRAHRQAWCWQDEWYGLNMENIRELEKEAQLMLSRKMAQFSEDDEGAAELAKDEAPQAQAPREPPQPSSSGGEPLAGRGLKKQWSTSSKSSRSSKRGASPSRHSISEWRMQSIARDSDESSDDEFFDAHEDLSDSEEMFPKDITKWNSNDLMDKIESPEPEDTQDGLYRQSAPEFRVASSVEQLNIIEDEVSPPLAVPPSKIHVLLLLLHGGTILDTGAGDPGSKQGDTNTIATVFDTVMRVHYPSALGHLAIRLVPCPPICSAAFALVSDLSPYSHDEGCLSSSQDHIPLAALPLLATSSPHYQEAVATVIQRANLAYGDFIKSQEGVTFNGQVCLIGDCVGGILAFDALCCSNQTVSESQSSSRRGSVASVQDTDLLSPGTTVNAAHGGTLESSRHLSRSNIDIPRSNGAEDPKQQLPRKRSDSSTYELDTIQQHQAFLSSLHASVLRNEPSSRHSSSPTMLDGAGAVGKFDFEIADLFLFGCPLGLVLALRKTVIPSLDVFQLRPACQQVYNLFHPADPSASRLEPLLERRFHALPPLSIPRYQRYPLGDGCSTLLGISCTPSRCGSCNRAPFSGWTQQMHSRPTTRSSKSTRPPPRPAQPPLPEVSAGPARSASPARCRAWLRATRRPALPRAPWLLAAPVAEPGRRRLALAAALLSGQRRVLPLGCARPEGPGEPLGPSPVTAPPLGSCGEVVGSEADRLRPVLPRRPDGLPHRGPAPPLPRQLLGVHGCGLLPAETGHEARQLQHLGTGRQGGLGVHPVKAEREVAAQEDPREAAERDGQSPDQ
uniref:Membrane-associated phosphatidylinositol transfer protein 2 isoform X6 n=1 Tax=Tursiops truncatus TaxID=9739 RepID=A0A6J3PR62_TURTR|nr:membrane-associated phosphatidylinositol transfer protein 2 isoform X6 [Tursiops truncatus]